MDRGCGTVDRCCNASSLPGERRGSAPAMSQADGIRVIHLLGEPLDLISARFLRFEINRLTTIQCVYISISLQYPCTIQGYSANDRSFPLLTMRSNRYDDRIEIYMIDTIITEIRASVTMDGPIFGQEASEFGRASISRRISRGGRAIHRDRIGSDRIDGTRDRTRA